VRHKVDLENPTEDTGLYFTRLSLRLSNASIWVISLLRNDQHHSDEFKLGGVYRQGCCESTDGNGEAIRFTAFDIDSHFAKIGDLETFQTFYNLVKENVNHELFTECNEFGEINQHQRLVFRFNCADSLDRTNVATVYYALIALAEFAKTNGVFLANPNSNDPLLISERIAVDFIIDMFGWAGNIVSIMYTNSEAMKAAHIYALVGRSSPGLWDGTISTWRRLQNYWRDDNRQDVINLWREQIRIFGGRRVDSRHLAVAPGLGVWRCGLRFLGHAVVSEMAREFVIDGRTDPEVFVIFQQPFVLAAVSIWLIPQPLCFIEMMISVGESADSMLWYLNRVTLPRVEFPQWVRFDLLRIRAESSQFPIHPRACLPWRVIQIKFSSADLPFRIGSLRFEIAVHEMTSGPRYEIKPTQVNSIKISDFKEIIRCLPTKPQLAELIQLERFRVENGLTDQDRNFAIVEIGRSPFAYDLRSRLLSRSHDCLICGAQNPSIILFPSCCGYPCLITRITQPTTESIAVCENCAANIVIEDNVRIVEEAIRQEVLIPVHRGISQPVQYFQEYIAGEIILSRYALFLNAPTGIREANAILSESGGECRFAVDERCQQFLLCFPGFVRIRTMTVLLLMEAEFDLSVRIPGGTIINQNFVENGLERVGTFVEHEPVEAILIEFLPKRSGEIGIKMMDVRGEFCDGIVVTPMVEPLNVVSVGEKVTRGRWDSVQRMQKFAVPTGMIVEAVTFHIVKEGYPLSFMIACSDGNEFKVATSLLLPEVKPEKGKVMKLTFLLEFRVQNCKKVCVFYLDRVPIVEPHSITFTFSKGRFL
jgi:hypothetical protein